MLLKTFKCMAINAHLLYKQYRKPLLVSILHLKSVLENVGDLLQSKGCT